MKAPKLPSLFNTKDAIESRFAELPELSINVYSQFKNSGVFPIAFALEMAGYVNYNGNTLLKCGEDDGGYKVKIKTR